MANDKTWLDVLSLTNSPVPPLALASIVHKIRIAESPHALPRHPQELPDISALEFDRH
jgi:hypothetical protein